MDRSGRAAIREMRTLSRLAPLLWLLAGLDRMLKGIAGGFVWEEDGRLVGNISIYRAEAGWAIANVAVHPDCRRQGIARRLMRAGVERVRAYGAPYVDLQVRHDNVPALALYRTLGFSERGTWATWRRAASLPAPPKDAARILSVREARRAEWRDIYALAGQARPEGMGWMRPVTPAAFRRSVIGDVLGLLTGRQETRYIVPSTTQNGLPDAALLVQQSMSRATDRLTLLVHPQKRGFLEDPLLRFGLRHLANGHKTAVIEHPYNTLDNGVLEALGFVRRQTLMQMRYRFQEE